MRYCVNTHTRTQKYPIMRYFMSTLTPKFYRRKPGHLGHLFAISLSLSRKCLTCLTVLYQVAKLGSPFNPQELEIFHVII